MMNIDDQPQPALHRIWICSNDRCGLRFPQSPTERALKTCPKCGAPIRLAEEPYHSFRILEKTIPQKKVRIVGVLDNIRSAFNVGAMFRTADGAGFESLRLCGITPTPEHPKVKKTALGAEEAIPWTHHWNSIEAISQLREEGWLIIALEGGKTAKSLFDSSALFRQNRPIALIVGNEVSGVDPEAVKLSDACAYIPMEGVKESLNVAIAFGIAAYLLRYGDKIL